MGKPDGGSSSAESSAGAAVPDIYYVTDHYLGYTTVLVRLSRVTPDVLRDFWRSSQVCDSRRGTPFAISEPPQACLVLALEKRKPSTQSSNRCSRYHVRIATTIRRAAWFENGR